MRSKRVGMALRLKEGAYEEYKKLHANVWPAVVRMIGECNICNYTIYYHGGILFSYFEYTGSDYDADMRKMANDPATQQWWEITEPLQESFEPGTSISKWVELEELFFLA